MESKKIQIKDYISSQVNIFIEPLVYTIVKKRPSNPVAFAINWLKEYASTHKEESDSEGQEEQHQNVAQLQAKIQKKKLQGKSKSRIAISEEVFGNFNKKQSLILKEVPKSQETQMLIKSLIRNSILFQNLDWKDEDMIIKAMMQKEFTSGQTVINEGGSGDQLFIVQSGQFQCFKKIEGKETYLKSYKHGEAFGELALMYNAPRAASIVCKTSGKLYALDRVIFSQVVKEASSKKRQNFKKVLNSIEIFKSIDSCDKQRFLDILKQEKYEEGQYIIKQGEQGNKFYIIIQGQLVAEKVECSNQLPRVVYRYKEGDYFGELSMIHDVCRQASVKALTQVRLASLDRESFKRIFGNMQELLKKNEERYTAKTQEMICA